MRRLLSITLAAAMLSTTTGCFGEFSATRSLYQWNDGLTSNKFLKTLSFYGLNIIPVYGVFALGDLIIFNLIEFWSGSNPLGMNEGDIEKQIIPLEGEDYIVETTKNQFKIYKENMEPVILKFDNSDKSWNLVKGGESQKLISFHETENGDFYTVYTEETAISLKADHLYDSEYLAYLFNDNQLVAKK